MKRILSIALAALVVLSALALSACQKQGDTAETTIFDTVSIPEDLTPYSVNADGRPTSYYKNEYDGENRLTRNYTYDALGRLTGSTGYEYDANGYESRDIMYDAEGAVTSQIVYERNEKGDETKRTELDASGAVVSVIEYQYNGNGDLTEINELDGSGNSIKRQVYDYDEAGELAIYTLYKGDAVEYTVTYVTSDDGTVTEYKYDGNGNLLSN